VQNPIKKITEAKGSWNSDSRLRATDWEAEGPEFKLGYFQKPPYKQQKRFFKELRHFLGHKSIHRKGNVRAIVELLVYSKGGGFTG
jgi:hypothetical protein